MVQHCTREVNIKLVTYVLAFYGGLFFLCIYYQHQEVIVSEDQIDWAHISPRLMRNAYYTLSNSRERIVGRSKDTSDFSIADYFRPKDDALTSTTTDTLLSDAMPTWSIGGGDNGSSTPRSLRTVQTHSLENGNGRVTEIKINPQHFATLSGSVRRIHFDFAVVLQHYVNSADDKNRVVDEIKSFMDKMKVNLQKLKSQQLDEKMSTYVTMRLQLAHIHPTLSSSTQKSKADVDNRLKALSDEYGFQSKDLMFSFVDVAQQADLSFLGDNTRSDIANNVIVDGFRHSEAMLQVLSLPDVSSCEDDANRMKNCYMVVLEDLNFEEMNASFFANVMKNVESKNSVYYPILWSQYDEETRDSIDLLMGERQTPASFNLSSLSRHYGFYRNNDVTTFALSKSDVGLVKLALFRQVQDDDLAIRKDRKYALRDKRAAYREIMMSLSRWMTTKRLLEPNVKKSWYQPPCVFGRTVITPHEYRKCVDEANWNRRSDFLGQFKAIMHNNSSLTTAFMAPPSRKNTIMIMVSTSRGELATRAKTIAETWGRDAVLSENVIIKYFVGIVPGSKKDKQTDLNEIRKLANFSSIDDIVIQSEPDNEYPPVRKRYGMIREANQIMLDYEQKNPGKTIDWAIKVDDDTFVNVQQLQNFIVTQNAETPQYLGRRGVGIGKVEEDMKKAGMGKYFCMGGPGILFSRPTMKIVGEKLGHCMDRLVNSEYKESLWHSDVALGYCVKLVVGLECWDDKAATPYAGFRTFKQNYLKGDVFEYVHPKSATMHPVKDMNVMHTLYETNVRLSYVMRKCNNNECLAKMEDTLRNWPEEPCKKGEIDYMRHYPEVISSVTDGVVRNAWDHYMRFGKREGKNYACPLNYTSLVSCCDSFKPPPIQNDLAATGYFPDFAHYMYGSDAATHFTRRRVLSDESIYRTCDSRACLDYAIQLYDAWPIVVCDQGEKSYLARYASVAPTIKDGKFKSAYDHYQNYGKTVGYVYECKFDLFKELKVCCQNQLKQS